MIKQTLQHNESYQLPADDSYPDEIKDGYQLNWVGKNYAKYVAGLKPVTVLEPDAEHHSLNENGQSQNVYITGDNLEVLKHLQNAYAGKVDMIYIDPPYNTGKEFVYHDEFHFSDAELAEKIGLDEKEIARVRQLNGRSSHSAWLTFIYPRLKIAARLLKPTGVIFISIDDNEQAQLKLLCDEVFGEGNDLIIWHKVADDSGRLKVTHRVRREHEYIIACYKSIDQVFFSKYMSDRNYKNSYTNPDNDPRGKYKQGIISTTEEKSKESGKNFYTVITPSGKEYSRQWRFSKEEFDRLNRDNRIYYGKDGSSVPSLKVFINEQKETTPTTLLTDFGTAKSAGQELIELFDDVRLFDYPKPIKLIKHLLRITTRSSADTDKTDKRENEENSCSEDVRERLRRKFDELAVPLEKLPFTPANFRKLFGRDGTVATPLGKVTIGKNQFEKLKSKEREDLLQAMYETLTAPIVILDEHRNGQKSHLFIKSFLKADQQPFMFVISVVVNIDGVDVSISTHQRRNDQVFEKITNPANTILYEIECRQGVIPCGSSVNSPSFPKGNDTPRPSLSAHSEKSQEENSPLDSSNTDKRDEKSPCFVSGGESANATGVTGGRTNITGDASAEPLLDAVPSTAVSNGTYDHLTPLSAHSEKSQEDLSAIRQHLLQKFDILAVPMEKIPFSAENIVKLFGTHKTVDTPLGKVKIGENQFKKLTAKEREYLLGAMKQTLTEPVVIIHQTKRQHQEARLYVKSFADDRKHRIVLSIVVFIKYSQMYVSVSTYEKDVNNILNKINTPADIIYEKQHRQEVVPGGNGDNPLTLSDGNRLSILSAHSEKSQEENSPLVLDFFSGSGTTAHAVMQLNAENAGKAGVSQIRYILVQLPEETPDNSEARKAGYETIDQIGMERIKRAAKKITAAKPAGLFNAATPDFGFQHFTCKTVDAQTIDKLDDFDELQKQQTAFSKDMITPFGLETILRTWLTDDGLELTENAAELKFGNYTAYYSEKLAKLYLIDKDETWNIESLKALLNAIGKNELTVKTLVIYAYSFSFRNLRELKTNLDMLDSKKPAVQERY